MACIGEEVEGIYDQVVEWRRDFHMYPELGYKEARTSAKVAERLRGFGLEVREGVAGYGVVGLLRGAKAGGKGKTIALRADMDALPIEEKTGLEFSSKNQGAMHACGHDGHSAMLLGVAALLSRRKAEIAGNVKFIFQPAEELAPRGGAKAMVEAGALENPKADAILGLHLFPFLPTGTINVGKGPMLAAGDSLAIDVFGKGGHGAEPHKTVDALVVACEIVNMLQTIVSRNVDPLETGIVTIGKLQAGTAGNIIADSARLEGTVRTFKPEVQELQIKAIERIVDGVAKAMGATAKVDYGRGYPAVFNDPGLVDLALEASARELPAASVVEMLRPLSVSEDFSNYIKSGIPGAFLCLGAGIPGREVFPNHHPRFDWDEEAMKAGMSAFMATALEYLA